MSVLLRGCVGVRVFDLGLFLSSLVLVLGHDVSQQPHALRVVQAHLRVRTRVRISVDVCAKNM